MRCRNKIPLLKHPNAIRRPPTRTNINPSPLPLVRPKGNPTLSRAELDTVAPKLFPAPTGFQAAVAQEKPYNGDSPVPAPKALVLTRPSSTKSLPSPTVRESRSNFSASSTTTITTASLYTPRPSHDTSCCSICLDFLITDPQSPIRTITACDHTFHSHCLQLWLQRYQPRCPLCQRWLGGRSNDDANNDVVVDRQGQDRSDGDGARAEEAVEEGQAGEQRRTGTWWRARWF